MASSADRMLLDLMERMIALCARLALEIEELRRESAGLRDSIAELGGTTREGAADDDVHQDR